MSWAYALGKLYSNTLIAVFNNRIYMSSRGMFPRSRTLATTGIDVKFRQYHPDPSKAQTSETQLENQAQPYRIEVFRETEVTNDIPMKIFGDRASASGQILNHDP
ncbi:hypothetical protein DXG01_011472 [Tephrocybe rancida]|nr:hypothetical protein DXG01_011472 [Tephrocybe rancida]